MAKSTSLALPDDVFAMLAAADKQRGFPAGTMQSLLMQETGGQAKYLTNPTAPHYAAGIDGKRKSSAYGPFGILESTGRDPGYGVAPMGDNTRLSEHVRFAADYLDARSKQAGSLQAGLAGYGEGAKYAKQVMGRIGAPVAPMAEQLAAQEMIPQVVAQVAPSEAMPAPVVAAQVETTSQENEWQTYMAKLRTAQAPVTPADLAYDKPQVAAAPQMVPPDFMAALAALGPTARPDFRAFSGFNTKRV